MFKPTDNPFQLDPMLDPRALAERFAVARRIQIGAFLAEDGAERLRAELADSMTWRHIVNGGEQVFEILRSDLDLMPAAQRAALDSAAISGATAGFQYRYDSIRVPDSTDERAASGGLLSAFADFMGSPDTLDLLATISGDNNLHFADAQATRYHPGDFLTRHDDNVTGKNRRLAYVLGLTAGWQPEWGGMLLFNDINGAFAEAFLPRFNALSLFSVPQPHSVGFVAPYAGTSRLSITGWLRSGV